MEIYNNIDIGDGLAWKTGDRFDEEIPVPIIMDYNPLRGYQGLPREMVDIGIPIMSKRLAKALINSGVDNIDIYEVILRNTLTSEKYDYCAYNVIGLISAANLTASDWYSYDGIPLGSVSFDNFVLDEKSCRNALLFRLAESLSTIMVHETVKNNILSSGIDTLQFITPDDWSKI